jgi:hypothetical protein
MKYFSTILIAYLFSSLTEYLLHRFWLHNNIEHHHTQKHHMDFGITYKIRDSKISDIKSSNLYILISILFSCTPILLIEVKLLYALTCTTYFIFMETIHVVFHKYNSTNIAFITTLEKHHRVHHKNMYVNFGIGSYLWDIILRTHKK